MSLHSIIKPKEMKSLLFLLLALISNITFLSNTSLSQLKWRSLGALPDRARYEDISFINEKTGWTITSYSMDTVNFCYIFKTTNGGASWNTLRDTLTRFYRCVGFADSLHGWIGTLGLRDTRIIIRTTNGGTDWMPSLSIPSQDSANVCGISVLNKDYVFACGRFYGPAYFYKTTNGGVNWTVKDMSMYAKGLVDCYFTSPDSGFVVGGVDGNWPDMKGIVLFTSDGGETWVERFRTTQRNQWGWKMSFPSRNVGYVSLEKFSSPCIFLKTTNGGATWQEKPFLNQLYNEEGIGFINENTGWLGGDNLTYKTTNGGDNWTVESGMGRSMNRFRFINDSVAYSAGGRIYKYSRDSTVGIQQISTEMPMQFRLRQNYPNPFNPGTKISFEVASPVAEVKLEVYNSLGQLVDVLVEEILRTGIYEVEFSAAKHPSGVYYYRLITNNYAEIRKMMLIK